MDQKQIVINNHTHTKKQKQKLKKTNFLVSNIYICVYNLPVFWFITLLYCSQSSIGIDFPTMIIYI